jgi:hypothetical protein
MSQAAIIGVVVIMMMSSSASAMLMMGSSPEEGTVCTPEGTKDTNATYKYDAQGKCAMTCNTGYKNESGKCVESTPPPPPKYQKYPDHDFTGGDISCEGGVEATACEAKCDANDKCVSYIHTANDKLCCIKHGTPNYKKLPGRQITGYIKNIDGYEVKEVGDRPAGDIENKTSATLPQCKARCDELSNCIGFNFNNGICWIKKSEGISPTYSNNGYQFYTKK